MSKVEYTSYYVGHGAMNYVHVMDDDGQTVIKILIDAGSKQDISPTSSLQPEAKASDISFYELMENIYNSGEHEWIFCLTHLHADHYSYFNRIFVNLYYGKRLYVIKNFYVGSVPGTMSVLLRNYDVYDEMFEALGVFNWWLNKIPNETVILSKSDTPILLWTDGYEDGVQLYLLFNSIYDSIDNEFSNCLNDNCANYLVKNVGSESMIWFTGDSTGKTFNYYLNNNMQAACIASIMDGCSRIYITVPHHGSIKTLKAGFLYRRQFWNTSNPADNWRKLCKRLFDTIKYSLVLSACPDDKYNHPDIMALTVLFDQCQPLNIDYGWDAYNLYQYDLSNEQKYGEILQIGDSDWYQQYKNMSLFPTLRCRLTQYEYASVTITI